VRAKLTVPGISTRDENGNRKKEYKRIEKQHKRSKAIAVYGGACFECKATNKILDFDHVNGDGKQHRLKESSDATIRRIARTGQKIKDYELQLLCCCCHWDKTWIRGFARKSKTAQWRNAAIEIYGSCAKCEREDRLSLDHVDGGGCRERKSKGGSATMLYYKIQASGEKLNDISLQSLCCCCHREKTFASVVRFDLSDEIQTNDFCKNNDGNLKLSQRNVCRDCHNFNQRDAWRKRKNSMNTTSGLSV
jgi:hypothetical protein